MFKYTIFFAVIVCSLHCSFASSIAKRDVQPEPTSNEIQQTAEKVIKEIESSAKATAKYIEWVINAVQELSKNLASDISINFQTYIIALALRLELFSMAEGTHFISPINDKLDKEHQILSITISEMLLNLEYMEKMDGIIGNTSDATSSYFIPKRINYASSISDVVSYFLKKIVEVIKSDSELNKKFIQLKEEVELRSLPPLVDLNLTSKTITEEERKPLILKWFSGKTLRSLLLTRRFVQHGIKDFSMIFSEEVFNRYTLVRSIFILSSASKSKLEKLQNVYDQTLQKTVEKWHPYQLEFITSKHLFTDLTEVLEKQPTLNAEITVLQKEVAKSTHFDKDTLQIHLLPF